MKNRNKHLHSKRDAIGAFDIINTILVVLITVITIYPLYFTVIASFSSPTEVASGNTLLWFKEFTLDHYKYVFQEKTLWVGYKNTIVLPSRQWPFIMASWQ